MGKQDMLIMQRQKAVCSNTSNWIKQRVTRVLLAMMYGLLLSLKNEIVKIVPKGRANCVAPGWVRTPMAEDALSNPDTVYHALATYVF